MKPSTLPFRVLILSLLLFGLSTAWPCYAQQPQPTRTEVYKTIGDVELEIHLFEPEEHSVDDERPAIVFFFGGGWTGGRPSQFYPQCEYLASRGMVAMSAEYRVKSRNNTTPFECVADAKSAVRWIRIHADELGIDPDRIAAGGGSAGGHVAACTGTIEGQEEEGEERETSSRPNAMVLFNPATDLEGEHIQWRIGDDWREISPLHHVDEGAPPTIILQGVDDRTTPLDMQRRFTEAMTKAGNRCELIEYEGQGHGFFNFGRGDGQHYFLALSEVDKFLASLGWLEGEPTLNFSE